MEKKILSIQRSVVIVRNSHVVGSRVCLFFSFLFSIFLRLRTDTAAHAYIHIYMYISMNVSYTLKIQESDNNTPA